MGQEAQIRRLAGSRKSKSSPPILSHEFVIQNHGDIFSCIIVLVLAGFMFGATSSLAATFVTPQYNETDASGATTYGYGVRDTATVAFYTVVAIVVHAIIQEYALDKLQRKLHLSKTKTAKFTESGHLAVFSLVSFAFAAYIMKEKNYLADISEMWTGYPHARIDLLTKLFFLGQIAYWLHQVPELYLSKIKRDEWQNRLTYTALYLVFVTGAYVLSLTRSAVLLFAVHFLCEAVYHLTRMAHFADKPAVSQPAFKVFNFLFVVTRLFTIALAFVTFWYGMRSSEVAKIDVASGNFNTPVIRLAVLSSVCLMQVYFMWNFIMFHLRQMRERSAAAARDTKANNKAYALRSKQRQTKAERKADKELRDLPEADQHTRVLRSGKAKAN